MYRVCTLLAIAGMASIAIASDVLPAHVAGHLYINMKTGERVMTPFNGRAGVEIWKNDDDAVCGSFFYGVDRPTRSLTDPRPRYGASVNNVGDVRGRPGVGVLIDGLGFGTATSGVKSTNTTTHSCAGFDLLAFFYDNDDANGTAPDSLARFNHSVVVRNIAAEEGTSNAWRFTVDLAGDGAFMLGDRDLDHSGALDFGWGLSLRQGQSLTDGINSGKGIAGPLLAAPGNFVNELFVPSKSTSLGVANRLHWYSAVTFDASGNPQDRSAQNFIGSYGFGAASSSNPYSSTYLVMYGPCVFCNADFNGDCFVGSADFDAFVSAFEAGQPTADIDDDGFLTFEDFDGFIKSLELGC